MKRFNFEIQRFANIDNSYDDNVAVNGTADNDSIFNNGNNVTITGGKGNDIINNNSSSTDYGDNVLFIYNNGDGNDSIRGFKNNSTLQIGGEYSTVESGNDVIVTVGDGNITLVGAATLSPLNIQQVAEGSGITINNTIAGATISGTDYNDSISNSANNVTINTYEGNDKITNTDNNKTYIDAGDGDDFISNSLKYSVETINGTETLISEYSDTSIVAGSGNDTISNIGGSYVSIISGDGDDSIYSKHSYYNTIDAGAGDDWIGISDGHYQNIFLGDGNDTLQGVQSELGDKASKWDVGGNANIDGGAGDDVISFGYANDSTITGGADNDYIIGFGAKSFITGGDGDDEIVLVPTKESSRDSTGATISGGQGNDTITLVDDADVVYSYEGGNDVIYLMSANDTLNIATDDTYLTTVNGNDLIVSLIGSQNTITLLNAASITPHIEGNPVIDEDGKEIKNPVAMIAKGDDTYYYESVARAANAADNNSTVTVIADSTETATINSSKGLTIQFAKSGLGVYGVSGGNFISADTSTVAQFDFTLQRILSNNDKNYLMINNGATSTLDGYVVTGTSKGYTFALQENALKFGDISYSGAGSATFDTLGKISLTSGAIVEGNNDVTSGTGISLTAGDYTINGASINANTNKVIFANGDDIQFQLASDTVTYNDMTFSGSGYATVKNDLPTLSAGVSISRPERAMVVLTERGQNTIDGRGFWLTEKLSDGITVGAVDNGIGVAHIIPYESFPEDAGKLFAEEALIYGDDSYTVRLNKDGIKSIYGLSAGSTVRGTAYFEGEVDTLGSILQLVVDSEGTYTFGDNTYTLGGAVDSLNVVAFSSRFYTEGTSALKNIYYLNGTVSGDFSSEVTINQASMGVQILGDTNINVYATDKAKPIDDAGKDIISSSGNVSVISGVGNGASIVSAGGATKITTNEEGSFIFRNENDSLQGQQAFTVSGDSSVDFILRNFTDAAGNPTMQVEGINNLENGRYTITKETEYHAINAGENITADDELVMQFSDKATFVIADSKIVSVSGIDTLINRLKGNVTVHATHAVTVNELDANVVGDTDFDVIVSDSKTVEIVNISAGASLSVSSVLVETNNNGHFNFGTDTYTINDTVDNSVDFSIGQDGAVENITNLSGSMKTSAQNVTVNGTAFTTSNTDASIISAGIGISRVEGLVSGDTVSGELENTAVVMSSDGILNINERNYILSGDSDGIEITGNRIDGLDRNASLEVGAAGTYIVNDTELTAKIGDTIIGTAENSAYVFDKNNLPLDTSQMSDDEIASQTGVANSYSKVETDTMMTDALLTNGGSALNGSMALALNNGDRIIEQTADFSNYTGKKRITLEGGDQSLKFNNEGGNVAVIESDSTGAKNITLGGGGDLVIVKDTDIPVNITAVSKKDTIVTSGGDVLINMVGGAKIVPNKGNLTLNNYDVSTGAGIQINETSDIEKAIANNNITLGAGYLSFGSSKVYFGNGDENSSSVNLFNNQGIKQKIAYTNNDGGEVDESGERENLILIGNINGNKDNSRFMSGDGDDTAIGGVGDYFDLGAGNNYVALQQTNNYSEEGATVAMTAKTGQTIVDGFNFSYGENADRVRFDLSNAQVSYKDGVVTFTSSTGSKIILNGNLGTSADLIDDDNFIGSTTIDDISPITYGQGEIYDNVFSTAREQIFNDVPITFAQG